MGLGLSGLNLGFRVLEFSRFGGLVGFRVSGAFRRCRFMVQLL